jgi:hypothetical protein
MIDDEFVVVNWQAPADNGSPILGYIVYIRQSDNSTYAVEPDNCDGSDSTIASATVCTIPVTKLFVAPFNLYWGYNIYATVVGYNSVGNSAVSLPGFDAVLLTNPDPPRNLVEIEAQRTTTSITFGWSDG